MTLGGDFDDAMDDHVLVRSPDGVHSMRCLLQGSRSDTRTLYHVTSSDAARRIRVEGFRHSDHDAAMGSMIYFAESEREAACKARSDHPRVTLRCRVRVGVRLHVPRTCRWLSPDVVWRYGADTVYGGDDVFSSGPEFGVTSRDQVKEIHLV